MGALLLEMSLVLIIFGLFQPVFHHRTHCTLTSPRARMLPLWGTSQQCRNVFSAGWCWQCCSCTFCKYCLWDEWFMSAIVLVPGSAADLGWILYFFCFFMQWLRLLGSLLWVWHAPAFVPSSGKASGVSSHSRYYMWCGNVSFFCV